MAGIYYGGPALAGAAIAANRFVALDTTPTPDTVVALTAPAGVLLGVTTEALAAGDQCVGVVTTMDLDVLIQLGAGVACVADTFLAAGAGGVGVIAIEDSKRMAKIVLDGTTAGLARCRLSFEQSLVPGA